MSELEHPVPCHQGGRGQGQGARQVLSIPNLDRDKGYMSATDNKLLHLVPCREGGRGQGQGAQQVLSIANLQGVYECLRK